MGKMKTSAMHTAMSDAIASPSPALPRGVFSVRATSVAAAMGRATSSVIGLTQSPEEQSYDHPCRGEQGIGHGACIAQVEKAQAGAKCQEREGLRGDAGAAASQGKGNVEQFQGLGKAK